MITLLDLPVEIIILIEQYANSTIPLLSTCKKLYEHRYLIKFRRMAKINSINKLLYFDNFINVLCHEIQVFPVHLKYLTFGCGFDQDIKGAIPNSVTHLTFGYSFNQDIKEAIPNTVTQLTFGYYFNQNVDNLPHNLTMLSFGNNFFQPVDNLPSTLKVLIFGNNFNNSVDNFFWDFC